MKWVARITVQCPTRSGIPVIKTWEGYVTQPDDVRHAEDVYDYAKEQALKLMEPKGPVKRGGAYLEHMPITAEAAVLFYHYEEC